MKNAVVIGHTSGIGRGLYNALPREGYTVLGMSRSNGFDLSKDLCLILDTIVSNQVDIVYNVAYSGTGQSELVLALYQIGYTGKVVSIGSVSADRTDAITPQQMRYAADKAHLRQISRMVCAQGFDSVYVELGMVDTEYNKNKPGPKLAVKEVVDILLGSHDGHHIVIRP